MQKPLRRSCSCTLRPSGALKVLAAPAADSPARPLLSNTSRPSCQHLSTERGASSGMRAVDPTGVGRVLAALRARSTISAAAAPQAAITIARITGRRKLGHLLDLDIVDSNTGSWAADLQEGGLEILRIAH